MKHESNLVSNTPHSFRGGTHEIYKFSNGYGASVVCNEFSYGGKEGLFELAVVGFARHTNNFEIRYDTRITNDVLGYLTEEEVEQTLDKIKNLDYQGRSRAAKLQRIKRNKK